MNERVDFVSLVKNAPESDIMSNFLIYRYKKGFASPIIIFGPRGTGKSSTCFRLSEIYNERLNPIRKKQGIEEKEIGKMVDSHLKFIGFVKNAQQGDDCILEEASVLYPSRRSMSDESVGISKVFDIIRKKRLVLFINAPMFMSVDKNIRSSAVALIQTYKIIKSEKAVLSRFWKLQTNHMSGKIYLHKFTRDGDELDFMYTKMPDSTRWKDYEGDKDSFIDDQYSLLLHKAEKKKEQELKEMGLQRIVRKPLTDKQKRVMELVAKHTREDTAKILEISIPAVAKQIQFSKKKGYSLEEFKNENKS